VQFKSELLSQYAIVGELALYGMTRPDTPSTGHITVRDASRPSLPQSGLQTW
jgi:hypothetical protein